MEPNKAYGIAADVTPVTRVRIIEALAHALRKRLFDVPDDAAGRLEVAVRWVPGDARRSLAGTLDSEMQAAMSNASTEP